MDWTLLIIATFFIMLLLSILKFATDRAKPSKKAYAYQKKQCLLTKNESNFYKQLLPVAAQLQLTVCPKVRLADIIEPQKGQNWQAAFFKIQAKHVDFVLCKSGLFPVLAIELDDKTHERPDRKERDVFVNSALQSAKLPILHIYNSTNLKQQIEGKLQLMGK
jgi:hypothetical protein